MGSVISVLVCVGSVTSLLCSITTVCYNENTFHVRYFLNDFERIHNNDIILESNIFADLNALCTYH